MTQAKTNFKSMNDFIYNNLRLKMMMMSDDDDDDYEEN